MVDLICLDCIYREVLLGVGADGVGAKFPIFAVNCSRLPSSSRRMRERRRKKTKKNQEEKRSKAKKKGRIPLTPSTPTPSRTSQIYRGLFKGGGVNERGGGFHTRVRGTMFVRNGDVTPGPSRECDITFFVKGRPKSARQSRDSTVAVRRVQSVTVPSSRVSRECRSPGLRSPLEKSPIYSSEKIFCQRPARFLEGLILFRW